MDIEAIKLYIPDNAKTELFDNVAIFEIPAENLHEIFNDLRNNKNLSLKLITATDESNTIGGFRIWYIFGIPQKNIFIIPYIQLTNTDEFPSLASHFHEAWNYERKIQTFFGLKPVGHPDTRPIILHENWPLDLFPLRKDFDWNRRPDNSSSVYPFQKIEGEGIYEIPVGPIHAGIIEPGHFRFSVAGEEIVLLEPRLGYTHKGSEKLFETLSIDDKIRLSEKISGDSSFSHSLAFCQAMETLGDVKPPRRALYLRLVYAELERIANHFGDIGMIMLDTGFNFGGAQGARLREIIMQINERLTGSRFLRGVNTIGGVKKDIAGKEVSALISDLENIAKDFAEVIDIAENNDSLLNRLKETGLISVEIAKDHGAVGVAARGVGIKNDTRLDFQYAAYDEISIAEPETEEAGDVYSRFRVRVKEVEASIKLIQQALQNLPEGEILAEANNIDYKKKSVAISLVEGWRGEIVYFVTTDNDGSISRVAPRDPSFVNWSLLGRSGIGNVVPDFPLINKSFNLSYSGNDL